MPASTKAWAVCAGVREALGEDIMVEEVAERVRKEGVNEVTLNETQWTTYK
jgi:hypothetical protein